MQVTRKKHKNVTSKTLCKIWRRAYTPALTWPPSQKVSQVEIEAGDSEGRLPYVFSFELCALCLLL